tara:strand:- start:1609 stop:1806 length:198 start_codon:yes stop_codon:yes gene_type:complete
MNTGFVIGMIIFLFVGAILNALDTGWNWLDCAVEHDHHERNRRDNEGESELDSGVAMTMWGLNND